MITIEVEGRRPLFGRLKGNPLAQDGSGDEPDIELTALGKAVRDEWLGIPRYFPQIEVMAVQMMPDHLHGILFVKERLPVHLGQVISGFKAGCRKAQRALAAGKAAAGEAAAEPLRTEKGAAAEPLRTEKGAAAEPRRQSRHVPRKSRCVRRRGRVLCRRRLRRCNCRRCLLRAITTLSFALTTSCRLGVTTCATTLVVCFFVVLALSGCALSLASP